MKVTTNFERGDVVKLCCGSFKYLGGNLWIDTDTYSLHNGVGSVSSNHIDLKLRYIASGDVIKKVLQGIPETNDVLNRK